MYEPDLGETPLLLCLKCEGERTEEEYLADLAMGRNIPPRKIKTVAELQAETWKARDERWQRFAENKELLAEIQGEQVAAAFIEVEENRKRRRRKRSDGDVVMADS